MDDPEIQAHTHSADAVCARASGQGSPFPQGNSAKQAGELLAPNTNVAFKWEMCAWKTWHHIEGGRFGSLVD